MSLSMPGSLDSHPLNEENRHTQPEDIQTTHDIDLFNDETYSMSEDPTATNAMDVNKREIENVQGSQMVCLIVQNEVGDKLIGLIQPIAKCRYQEVDHSHTLCQTVYDQDGQAKEMRRKIRGRKIVRTEGSMDISLLISNSCTRKL
jgi:hypothetical protein